MFVRYYLLFNTTLAKDHSMIEKFCSKLMPEMRIAARWKVHRRDEIILDELCESGNFLILLLHYFDVLCKLDKTCQYKLQQYLDL